MAFWSRWLAPFGAPPASTQQPRAAAGDGGLEIRTPQDLEEALRRGMLSNSGEYVSPDSAMRIAAVFASIRIRSSVPANMPLGVKRRVDDRVREDASDHWLWTLLCRRPNRWQKPAQFRRMMQAHVLLRGNAYALKVKSRGRIIELAPLHPDRVEVKQRDDLSIEYVYTRRDGRQITLSQDEVFHLFWLTFDGVHGVSPIAYARETLGAAMAMERHGANFFRNGAQISAAFKHPKLMSDQAYNRLKASIDEHTGGDGAKAGKGIILEEGLDVTTLSMAAKDAEWMDARKMSRTDIFMFYGIPPHMAGDTEKSTSWGTGLEQQTQGFVSFTAEDDLTMWEEAINSDLVPEDEPKLYVRFNRASLVRGDIKTRYQAHALALQWGFKNPDDVRADEEMNPREDGRGGQFYDPPNTAGDAGKDEEDKDDEPSQTA